MALRKMSIFLILLFFVMSKCQTDDERRMELCENLIPAEQLWDIQNFRYDSKTKKCYHLLYDNPCGNEMKFYAEVGNSIYGHCDCRKDSRTLIYHPVTDQCYLILKQGYCSSGQWLTLSQKTGKPICERNPCLKTLGRGKRMSGEELVLFNGRCVFLGTKGCADDDNSKVVRFVEGKILPTCWTKDQSYGGYTLGGVAAPDPCKPGSSKSISGGCQYGWMF